MASVGIYSKDMLFAHRAINATRKYTNLSGNSQYFGIFFSDVFGFWDV